MTNKEKFTNTSINNWYKSAEYKAVLWDTVIKGLNIRRNKNDATFYIFYRNANNQQRNYALGKFPSITLNQAQVIARDKIADIAKGIDIQLNKRTSKSEVIYTGYKYLDEIYNPIKLHKQKDGKGTYNRIKNHSNELLSVNIESITPQDIQKWQIKISQKNLSFASIEKAFKAFKTMLNHAKTNGYIHENPIRDISLDKEYETVEQLNERKAKRTYLTIEQMQAFIKALDDYQGIKRKQRESSINHGKPLLPSLANIQLVDYVKPMLLTMFYTGFRNGDVISLRWEEVNLPFKRIVKTLEKTSTKKPHPMTFPISEPLVDILKIWHKQQGEPTTGYVFPSDRTGSRRASDALTKPFHKIKELAGLPTELQPYTLRHNFISWLVMQGVDLLTVAKLAGHSDVTMIVQHYAHLQPNLLADSVNAFAKNINTDAKEVANEN